MLTRRIVTIAIIAFPFAQASWAREPKRESAPGKPPTITTATVQASNAFACDMLRALAKEKPDANAFISPWSISTALAMTMEGAREKTALQMGRVLRLPEPLHQSGDRPWKLEGYHAGFADLQRRYLTKGDPAKDQPKRDKIAALRAQLDTLNKKISDEQIEGMRRGDRDDDASPLRPQAEGLASEINRLQDQLAPFELRTANSIWAEQTYPFDPAYSEAVGRYYGTGLLRQADFINQYPAERDRINGWVGEQTANRIKDLVPPLAPDQARRVRMILVNAIYFKGVWDQPFDKRATQRGPFSLADGGQVQTNLMKRVIPARYAAFQGDGTFFDTPKLIDVLESREETGPKQLYPGNDGFLIAEIPYKGDALSMVVIAPQSPAGLRALEAKLTGAALDGWLARLEKRQVAVTIPKFKLKTHYQLAGTLKAAGMSLAFEPTAANFTGMSLSRKPEDNLFISEVVHKTFVEVDEEGTEAAAATAILMVVPVSGTRSSEFTPAFRADRPFLFLIREVHTGAVLFLARVTKP